MNTPRCRRRRMRGEKGYVLAMVGLLIVPLLVFTAFAVDVGAWYAQGAKMQRAVDAASLAGVVQLPNQTAATAAANATLDANGFNHSTYSPTYTFPNGAGETMVVTISVPANQYFSGIVLQGETLTRTATAVYNLRIPLGSPNNSFGNNLPAGCTSTTSTASPCPNPNVQPNLWAAINGPYSNHQDGDAYSTHCAGQATGATSCDGLGANNATYRTTGFLWAVDVPAADIGKSVTVQIYDPALGGTGTPLFETSSNGGFSTSYQLFMTTGASAQINLNSTNGMDQLSQCTGGTPGYKVFGPGTGASFFTQAWYTLCTFTPTVAGIYPLQVKSSAIPGITDTGGGWNVYSLKASVATGTQPQVYALNDMSIWTPQPGNANFYLANIGPQYAGHTLVIDLYDPGDGSAGPNGFQMQFLMPPSGLGTVPSGGTATGCNYNATPSATIGPATPNTSANCTILTQVANGTSGGIYNNAWLRVSIAIPSSYTCSTDCWWWVSYKFDAGSSPTDRTVWVVNVLGDPVHLTN
jgi:Flp pilus assembly protein TadG